MSPRYEVARERAQRQIEEREHRYAHVHRTPPGTGLIYGEGSSNSWFRDLALIAARDERKRAALDSPVLRGSDPGDASRIPSRVEPLDLDLVEARLNRAAREATERLDATRGEFARAQFDLSAAGASAIVPTQQLPAALAADFETAARGKAVVADLLNAGPIPDGTGMTTSLVRVTTGSSVTVQAAEGDANAERDLVLALGTGSIAYATGQIDVPRQLLDRATGPGSGELDKLLAADLGRAAGLAVDQQVLYGTGSNGQTTGLLVASGTNAVTYTDASPTVAEYVSRLGSTYATTATADGQVPDVLLLHPRRKAWLASQAVSGEAQPGRVFGLFAGGVVEAPAIPTDLGGGGTEDRAIALRSSAVRVFSDSRITVHPGALSGTNAVRFVITARVAVIVGAPAGVGILSGSGCAAPTFA